ncbi:MAG: ABC transporter substrate-binding protein [Pseudomonadota bacterium]|jgi:putative tryptophan/tyrosine transport system substrate-binding protein|nr:hypothetical protein [Methyloversatilis discipulorum]
MTRVGRIGLAVRMLLMLCSLLLCGLVQAASVLVLLSEPGGAYGEFAEALKNERSARGGFSLAVATRNDFNVASLTAHDAVIAVGAGALRTVVQADVSTPVLSVLVPQSAFESMLTAGNTRRWSAIHIDQPFIRQVDLIRIALPEARRIGVLFDAADPERLQPLKNAVAGTSMQISSGSFTGESSLFAALSQVLDNADVFLALPDPQVHNAGTIRNLLLTSFRARVPVVGFSAAYARAGAVMSLYSTPEQIARQTADAIAFWMRERTWPTPRHPRHFTVSVNAHVARSLGLRIEDGDALRDKLVRQERLP